MPSLKSTLVTTFAIIALSSTTVLSAHAYGSGTSYGSDQVEEAVKEKAKNEIKAYGSDKVEDAKSYGSDKGVCSEADRKKAHGSHKAKDATESYGSDTAPATPSAPAINCPAGTTPQADGTCMLS